MEPYSVPLAPEHEGRGRCYFTGDTPGEPQCDQLATVHLWITRPDLDDAYTLACDDHVALARDLVVLDEHAFGAVCGLPGTLWDFDNHCCVLDGSGIELPAKVAAIEGVPC